MVYLQSLDVVTGLCSMCGVARRVLCVLRRRAYRDTERVGTCDVWPLARGASPPPRSRVRVASAACLNVHQQESISLSCSITHTSRATSHRLSDMTPLEVSAGD